MTILTQRVLLIYMKNDRVMVVVFGVEIGSNFQCRLFLNRSKSRNHQVLIESCDVKRD